MVHAVRAHPPLTLDEWAARGKDEPGELVDGFLEEEEVTTYLHEFVEVFLLAVLFPKIFALGGMVFGAEGKVRIGKLHGRKPDIAVYFPGTKIPSRRARIAKSPPSTIIEILSPGEKDQHRDRVTKRAEYAAIGVPYYWIVDPEARTVEALRLVKGSYVQLATVAGGLFAVPGCESVVVNLDEMWLGADRLPDEDPPSSRKRRKKAPPAETVARNP